MTVMELLHSGIVFLDGGTGAVFQQMGLKAGERPELWNQTHPEQVTALHRAYYEAGSHIVSTNTFGINGLKYSQQEIETLVGAAVSHVKAARMQAGYTESERYVALDVGPTGKMLKPLGDLDFEKAVAAFQAVIEVGVAHGVDLIFIETMNDSLETKAAVLAAKESCDLPVFVTTVYDETGKLMTGAGPEAMVALLEGLRADAIGLNCSLGPEQMKPVVERLAKVASVPLVVKPNAGLPHVQDGKTVYDVLPEEFARSMKDIVNMGARVIGGCCGTTPEYIRVLHEEVAGMEPCPLTDKDVTLVSSYASAVEIGEVPVLIGERLNPTGKPKLKEALKAHRMDEIVREGLSQEEAGAHILDVNVGLPGIDEPQMMCDVVLALQAVTPIPLQIDTSNVEAMERALRIYNGKPMINSVNGKAENMAAVLPLAAKYGGVLIALTLDEEGIPETAEGRVAIAKRIYQEAAKYGIPKKDILVDPLTMAVSASGDAAKVTLEAVRRIRQECGGKTSLGVSNVSFGLPGRDIINSVFFALALENGLNAAIMNPHSGEMMKAYRSFLALKCMDANCVGYIAFAQQVQDTGMIQVSQKAQEKEETAQGDLIYAIVKGLSDAARTEAEKLCQTREALEVINQYIVPALDQVGKGFEQKTVFLPQLLLSAEAAKAAFEQVKEHITVSGEEKYPVILATVKGDIHDIGKNIVKVLLESYGFPVIDLGRDVAPERIVQEAKQRNVPLVGLSALMTTTVGAMEETIKLLRRDAPNCKVVVGGAVLTEDFARQIGADKYAADAMETVRYAEELLTNLTQTKYE